MPDGLDLLQRAGRVLAGLFPREQQARFLCQDAGADPEDLPSWGTVPPREGWRSYLQVIDQGIIPPVRLKNLSLSDGVFSVLTRALKDFPSNRDLPTLIEAWEEYLADVLPSSFSLRVLFLTANPVDTPLLRIGLEFRTLQERLAPADLPVKIEVRPFFATEPHHLLESIMREKPAVVHFSGHGEQGGQIALEGRDGQKVLLSPEALGDAFRAVNYPLTRRPIRCVVLNACHSDPAARAICQSVDAVIGTGGEIADDAAIGFVKEFYGGLANRRPVGNAVELGRAQMRLAAEAAGVRGTQGTTPDSRFFAPELVSVHTMNRVKLDRLVLGGR
jgi:hypothetical protein